MRPEFLEDGYCYYISSISPVPQHGMERWRQLLPENDDVLFSVVAPINVGWAGFAWGGSMTNNPLTLGWANGAKTLVSSRWAA